jgi:hypothetical protein
MGEFLGKKPVTRNDLEGGDGCTRPGRGASRGAWRRSVVSRVTGESSRRSAEIPDSGGTYSCCDAHSLIAESTMIRAISLLASLLIAAGGAAAQDKPTAQQQKMKTCNAQASKKELKGDERQAFMSQCLKADSAKKGDGKELTAQQKKMKSCNAQAGKKQLKDDERKAFMSQCLKADA